MPKPPIPHDRELTCKQCNNTFIFEGGEQLFFAKSGFPDPVRCKPCRAKKKAKYGESQT